MHDHLGLCASLLMAAPSYALRSGSALRVRGLGCRSILVRILVPVQTTKTWSIPSFFRLLRLGLDIFNIWLAKGAKVGPLGGVRDPSV